MIDFVSVSLLDYKYLLFISFNVNVCTHIDYEYFFVFISIFMEI